jgi:hypothetical protein
MSIDECSTGCFRRREQVVSLRHGADIITTISLFLAAIEGMVISYMHKK